jgi:hypothetical protein
MATRQVLRPNINHDYRARLQPAASVNEASGETTRSSLHADVSVVGDQSLDAVQEPIQLLTLAQTTSSVFRGLDLRTHLGPAARPCLPGDQIFPNPGAARRGDALTETAARPESVS